MSLRRLSRNIFSDCATRVSFLSNIIACWSVCLVFSGDPVAAQTQDTFALIDTESPSPTKVSKSLYGLNLWNGSRFWRAEEPQYKEALAYMNPGIVRIHNAGMTSSEHWIKDGQWNATSINRTFSAIREALPDTPIMLNLPSFHGRFNQANGVLDRSEHQAYGDFVAELVKIINVDQGHNVSMIEVINEKDLKYASNASMSQYAWMHNIAAEAIKEIDPSIKVIAGAFTAPDTNRIRNFARQLSSDIDGFSYHQYATGTTTDNVGNIYPRARAFANSAEQVRGVLDDIGREDLELHFDEYNMFWNWRVDDFGLQQGVSSAIFDGLVFKELSATDALDGMMAWNESDGVYGKTTIDNQLRPSAHLFSLANEYMYGDLLHNYQNSPNGIYGVRELEIMATQNDEYVTAMLINTSDELQTVDFIPLGLSLEDIAEVNLFEVDDFGFFELGTYDSIQLAELGFNVDGKIDLSVDPTSVQFVVFTLGGVSVVPEPQSLLLMLLGTVGTLLRRRRSSVLVRETWLQSKN